MDQLPSALCQVVTPLQVQQWLQALVGYPDRAFADFLLRGIGHGFRIGYSCNKATLKHNFKNMASARDRPGVVEKYIEAEESQGRIMEVSRELVEQLGVHVSPFLGYAQKE